MTNLEKCLPVTKDKVIEITRKNEDQNILLSLDVCMKHDFVNYKKRIKNLFKRLKQIRYMNPEEDVNITSNYELNSYRSTSSNSSSTESSVDAYIDMVIYENEVCQKILHLANKMTYEEGMYFVYTFLSSETEDCISEKLSISRTTLQKIKKSCLVKAWFELKIYCEDD